MTNIQYFTEEGLEQLKKDLDYLRDVERPNISKEIAEARDKGDLSENAEYDAAKEAQGILEVKIASLEEKLSKARLLDQSKLDITSVHLLTKVTIKNIDTALELTYMIVPESEADLKAKKISVGSPIGKGLLGKKVGDIVKITIPTGIISFEILSITR